MAFYSGVHTALELAPIRQTRRFSHVAASIPDMQNIETQTDFLYVHVSRDLFTQEDIDVMYERDDSEPEKRPFFKRARDSCADACKCNKDTLWRLFQFMFGWIPIIPELRHYDMKKLIGDVMGGVSVACLHFPQGLAYGILASLSPVQGLYTSFFPVLLYSLFGTCQHMAFGTDSIVAILTAEIIDTQAHAKYTGVCEPSSATTTTTQSTTDVSNNSAVAVYVNDTTNGTSCAATSATPAEFMAYKITVSMCITFVCGLILYTMGITKLGLLTTFQSKSFIGGFTTAASFQIFSSQVPKALGIQIPLVKGIGKMVIMYKLIIEKIAETNIASLIIVICCCVMLLFLKDYINIKFKDKLRVPLPADLMTIILATIVSKLASLDQYDVDMVGNIPVGIPPPVLPDFSVFWAVFPECLQMSLLIFFLCIAMVKVCTEKHEYEVDDNKELVAYGLTNMCCSFFPVYPASTSPPRNMILSAMGARTTVNGLFTALILLLVLFVLGQLFAMLPVPALAAMIFVSVKPLLLQVKTLPKLYKVNVYDFTIWIAACSTGILLDLPYGLLFGIGTSFVAVILQSQKAEAFSMCLSHEQVFVRKQEKTRHPSIAVFRMCSSLYFATSELFKKKLYAATTHPHFMKKKTGSGDLDTDTGSEGSNQALDEITEEVALRELEETEGKETKEKEKEETQKDPDSELIKIIIIDCSCCNYIDVQGVNALSVVFEEYRRVGVTVYLAACQDYMWKCLLRSDFFNIVPKERAFFQIDDAFSAAKSVVD